MNIGFVVNQFHKETPVYTTAGLALQASKMGHEVYYISVGDFSYTPDELMGAMARQLPKEKNFRGTPTLLEALKQVEKKKITSLDLDVMLLRNDPAADMGKRPWAQNAGIVFGQLAKQQNVLVLNDPHALSLASNKMYFQYFPKEVRPATIITRNVADITYFFHENKKKIILKPLQGSGGKNVFMIDKDIKNLHQIVEAISRDGFVVAQEYLPAAKDGDIRVFLVDGEPIMVKGHMAAIHRHQKEGDIRSNIHAGGYATKARVTKKIKAIIEQVAEKLKADGMFLCGLDIVGDKLMEVNVFSPGGLYHACDLYNVDFYEPVIHAIEKKLNR